MEWYEIRDLEDSSYSYQDFENEIEKIIMEIMEWKQEDLE